MIEEVEVNDDYPSTFVRFEYQKIEKRGTNDIYLLPELQAWGAHGWELVSVNVVPWEGKLYTHIAWLKRPYTVERYDDNNTE